MTHFAEHGYEVVRGAVHAQTLQLLATEFQMLKDNNYYFQGKAANAYQGDGQTERSFFWYAPYCFESLMVIMQEKIETVTQKKLAPAYSYARIYYKGATLDKHVDRPSCQYSASVCIENDQKPWTFWFKNRHGQDVPLLLEAGDMVVYQGDELTHWREEYEGNKQIQTFIHYVEVDGKFDDYVFDKRPMLGLPGNARRG